MKALVDNYLKNMEFVENIGLKRAWRKLSAIRQAIDLLEKNPPDDPALPRVLEKLKENAFWLNFAINRCRTRLYIHSIVKRKESHDQTERRTKRKTWRGMTKEQLKSRDEKIIEHFKKTHLTAAGFADKHSAKYGLKSKRVRDILKKALGS